MRVAVVVMLASLVVGIVFTFAAERSSSARGDRLAWGALIALYGVCVGIGSAALIYFFGLGELAALLVGIPLGVPVFFVAAKMAEA